MKFPPFHARPVAPGRSNAELVQIIRERWREVGREVEVGIVAEPAQHGCIAVIRSNLVGGLPPERGHG